MSGFKEITGGERGRWEGVENLSEFYYKEEQRQSGNFQKKWDQGFLKARILKRLAIKKHSRDRSKIWLLRWLSDEEPTCQCRRHELILGWGRCPEEANGNPLQYSCLGNPMDRGA